jgi:putative membrane protein
MKSLKIVAALIALHLAAGSSMFADDRDKGKNYESKSTSSQQQDQSSSEQQSQSAAGQEIDEAAGAQKQESLEPKDFLKEAAQCNMMELKLSKLAAQRAQNPSLKQFAERLVQDHAKADKELKQLAERKGVSIPSDLEEKHQKHVEHFSSLSGEEFDKAFAKHMVKDHKKEVARYEKVAEKATDPELQSFARNALPALRTHLQMARQFAPDTEQAEGDIIEPAGAEPGESRSSDDEKRSADDQSGDEEKQSPDIETTPDR